MADRSPTGRFSDRVADYERYRPGYPPEVGALLRDGCGVGPGSVVADVGAGTGISTQVVADLGAEVVAIEPNDAMREAAEHRFAGSSLVRVTNGSAEATGLPDGCVDVVFAGQSFHWFDHAAARTEFARILRPGGWVVLAWNERSTTASSFLAGYEQLLRERAVDYAQVDHRNVGDAGVEAFFAPNPVRIHHFANEQVFDRDGFVGRALSSSYVPGIDDPERAPFVEALDVLFAERCVDDRVTWVYDTTVYLGHLDG